MFAKKMIVALVAVSSLMIGAVSATAGGHRGGFGGRGFSGHHAGYGGGYGRGGYGRRGYGGGGFGYGGYALGAIGLGLLAGGLYNYGDYGNCYYRYGRRYCNY